MMETQLVMMAAALPAALKPIIHAQLVLQHQSLSAQTYAKMEEQSLSLLTIVMMETQSTVMAAAQLVELKVLNGLVQILKLQLQSALIYAEMVMLSKQLQDTVMTGTLSMVMDAAQVVQLKASIHAQREQNFQPLHAQISVVMAKL